VSIILRIRLAWHTLSGGALLGVGDTTSARVAAIAARGLVTPNSLTLREIRAVCASALMQAAKKL